MLFAFGFVTLYAILLTFAPIVRLRSWEAGITGWHWVSFSIWLVGFVLLYRQAGRLAPGADPYLLPLLMLLSGWGLLAISRLDANLGLRQAIWIALGLVLFWYGLRFQSGLTFLRRYKYIWLTVGLAVTALTLVLGTYPGGTGPRLWLGCCGMYFQPSEPLKLLLIVYLAAYLADRLPVSFNLFGLLAPSLVLVGLALVLLVVQRDLGTATLFILIYTLSLFLASGKRRMLLLCLAALLVAAMIGFRYSDVVQLRVNAWLHPWQDPSGDSYQLVQSLLAVASGGLIGTGPGLGSPGVVPVAVSDFIYPAIVEETGLLGAAGLILAYAFLILRGLIVALNAPYNFHRYLAAGISAYFACQVVIIIGGNLRLLPLTGVTLPFMSYGGSSLLTCFTAVLILILISRQSDQDPAPLSRALPYNFFFACVSLALATLVLATGWFGLVRQGDLLGRTDNPRRAIEGRYVQRGALLDRDNRPITTSTGMPGEMKRNYLVPALSLTTGYSDAQYGQAGLEATQDAYLRGLQGSPSFTIWWNRLLYGQPPPGLDLRLSINLDIQNTADAAFGEAKGAAVLLNAATGEILAIVSHPYFDPNKLAEDWSDLVVSPDAPLVNRATQGLYPPGPAIAPIILSEIVDNSEFPNLPESLDYRLADQTLLTCAIKPDDPTSWGSVLSSGCPAPLALLGSVFLPARIDSIFQRFGLAEAPQMPLLTAQPQVNPVIDIELASLGQDGLLVSPLQMAMVAAVISNQGGQHPPLLPMAVRSPQQGWVIFPEVKGKSIIDPVTANAVGDLLSQSGKLNWKIVAIAEAGETPVTWYLGGSIKEWQGAPLAVAVVIEENNPSLAQEIGEILLQMALNTN